MQTVTYTPDDSECSISLYTSNPDFYRGNIACCLCNEKAWFVKGFTTEKYFRSPCFAAHHHTDCENKIILVADDENGTPEADPSTIQVDLDKQRKQSIDIPLPNSKKKKENRYGMIRRFSSIAEYPENKSLRQILTSLSRNPNYPEDDATIKMTAESGRIVLAGNLKDYLVPQSRIPETPPGELRIFWGRINNVNKRDGVLWLNCGDYKKEPSILIEDEDQEEEILEDFKLKEFDDLNGADFIIVGVAIIASNGKPYIKFPFTKYAAFRKYSISHK